MEYILPLSCSSGKGRKCTVCFFFFLHKTVNIYKPQPHGTYRNMKRQVFPLVPYNLEKLVKKQHNLKVSGKCR